MTIDIEELKKLAEAATPGPYKEGKHPELGSCMVVTENHTVFNYKTWIARHLDPADAAYVVAACNAVPELIARIRSTELEVDCAYQRDTKTMGRLAECKSRLRNARRRVVGLEKEAKNALDAFAEVCPERDHYKARVAELEAQLVDVTVKRIEDMTEGEIRLLFGSDESLEEAASRAKFAMYSALRECKLNARVAELEADVARFKHHGRNDCTRADRLESRIAETKKALDMLHIERNYPKAHYILTKLFGT